MRPPGAGWGSTRGSMHVTCTYGVVSVRLFSGEGGCLFVRLYPRPREQPRAGGAPGTAETPPAALPPSRGGFVCLIRRWR